MPLSVNANPSNAVQGLVTPSPFQLQKKREGDSLDSSSKRQKVSEQDEQRFGATSNNGGYNRWGLKQDEIQSAESSGLLLHFTDQNYIEASRNQSSKNQQSRGQPAACWFCLANPNVRTYFIID